MLHCNNSTMSLYVVRFGSFVVCLLFFIHNVCGSATTTVQPTTANTADIIKGSLILGGFVLCVVLLAVRLYCKYRSSGGQDEDEESLISTTGSSVKKRNEEDKLPREKEKKKKYREEPSDTLPLLEKERQTATASKSATSIRKASSAPSQPNQKSRSSKRAPKSSDNERDYNASHTTLHDDTMSRTKKSETSEKRRASRRERKQERDDVPEEEN